MIVCLRLRKKEGKKEKCFNGVGREIKEKRHTHCCGERETERQRQTDRQTQSQRQRDEGKGVARENKTFEAVER